MTTATLAAPRIRKRWGGYVFALLATIWLLAFVGKNDPDHEAYRAIYEVGGHWLEMTGRDPLFVAITQFPANFTSYDRFRLALCVVFGLALLFLVQRFRYFSLRGITFASALFLTPFVIHKLHIQIREGMAMLLWFFAITGSRGDIYKNVHSLRFWLLLGLSCSIHISAAIWWSAAILCGLWRRPTMRRTVINIVLLFALFGAMNTSYVRQVLMDTILRNMAFGDRSLEVESTDLKFIYWSAFLIIPITILLRYRSRIFYLPNGSPSVLGLIGTVGLIGFQISVLVGLLIFGVNMKDMAAALRLSGDMVVMLGLALGFRYPRSPLAWLILLFITIDFIRRVAVQS